MKVLNIKQCKQSTIYASILLLLCWFYTPFKSHALLGQMQNLSGMCYHFTSTGVSKWHLIHLHLALKCHVHVKHSWTSPKAPYRSVCLYQSLINEWSLFNNIVMVIWHGAVPKLPQLQLHSATVAPLQLISFCPWRLGLPRYKINK